MIVRNGSIKETATYQGSFDSCLSSLPQTLITSAPASVEEPISMLDWALTQAENRSSSANQSKSCSTGRLPRTIYDTIDCEIAHQGSEVAIMAGAWD